jgi:hypothetical protein
VIFLEWPLFSSYKQLLNFVSDLFQNHLRLPPNKWTIDSYSFLDKPFTLLSGDFSGLSPNITNQVSDESWERIGQLPLSDSRLLREVIARGVKPFF